MSNRYPATTHDHNWFKRMAYLFAAGIFLVLGIIGLVLPVLPGVIFLLIAALILARISRRVDRWVKQHPVTRNTQARVDTISRLNWVDKVRITGWYAAAALASLGVMAGNGIRYTKALISQSN